jgi:hypothetical protein
MRHAHTLAALDGANPLGMLATLGAFRIAALHDPEATLHWTSEAGWRPVITTCGTEHELVERIVLELYRLAGPRAREVHLTKRRSRLEKLANEKARKGKSEPGTERRAQIEAEESELVSDIAALEVLGKQQGLGLVDNHDLVAVPRALYRGHAEPANRLNVPPCVPSDADFYAALGCDAILKEKKGVGPAIQPTPFSFSNGGSGKCLLKDFRNCAAAATRQAIGQIIDGHLAREDAVTSLLWDPMDQQSYALRWADPGNRTKSPPRASATANALAFLGLTFLPCLPDGTRLVAIGMDRRARSWAWPLWSLPATEPLVRSLLALKTRPASDQDRRPILAPMGIKVVYACRRYFLNKRPFFSPAKAI